MATTPKLIDVDLGHLVEIDESNPNVFEPAKFDKLVAGIRTHGFLQPILVCPHPSGAGYILVDGVHRRKAALACGYTHVPAVLAECLEHARILRIAMNNLRGQLNLSEVGRQLQEMLDEGFGMEDVELTGYADWEIEALMDSVADLDDEDLLAGADTAEPKEMKDKTFNITLKYNSESERARVREALAAAGSGDLILGLNNLIEGDDV